MISLGSASRCRRWRPRSSSGLREHIGGAPDHLSLEVVVDPAPAARRTTPTRCCCTTSSRAAPGYLAELADAETLRTILLRAYEVVRDCELRGQRTAGLPQVPAPVRGPGQSRPRSRVEAEKQLKEILLAGSADRGRADGRPGGRSPRSPSVDFDPESKMEQKFRAVLKERLQVLGATVKEHAADDG